MQVLTEKEQSHQKEVEELQQQLLFQQQATRELQAAMQMKLDEQLHLLARLETNRHDCCRMYTYPGHRGFASNMLDLPMVLAVHLFNRRLQAAIKSELRNQETWSA